MEDFVKLLLDHQSIICVCISVLSLIVSYKAFTINKKIQDQEQFKLRYASYQRIVEVFRELAKHDVYTIMDHTKSNDFYMRKYSDVLFDSGLLFGNEVEESLRKKLIRGDVGSNILDVINEEGEKIEGTWIPNDNFNKLFKPYLRLNVLEDQESDIGEAEDYCHGGGD